MVALMIALAAAQRWVLPLAGRIAQRVVPGSLAATQEVTIALAATYERHARIVLAFLLNLLGWVASAAGAWVVLRLMQVPVSIWTALSIESVIFILRSAAFAVPGGIGVQEAGYALVAPLFGLPAESALALALAKRARDLAIGIPTLLLAGKRNPRGRAVGPQACRGGPDTVAVLPLLFDRCSGMEAPRKAMSSTMQELDRRRHAARTGGGEKRIAAQHAKGKAHRARAARRAARRGLVRRTRHVRRA